MNQRQCWIARYRHGQSIEIYHGCKQKADRHEQQRQYRTSARSKMQRACCESKASLPVSQLQAEEGERNCYPQQRHAREKKTFEPDKKSSSQLLASFRQKKE